MYRIAFEGGDGSGKSTQALKVYEYLNVKYPLKKLWFVNEPRVIRNEIMDAVTHMGEGEINDAYLSYLFSKDGYYDRMEELEYNPDILIRDRDTTVSEFAYHHKFGTPDEMVYSIAWQLNKINSLDLLIFVDVPVEIAYERIQKRVESEGKKVVNYFEKKDKLFKIRENYLDLLNNQHKLELCGLENVKIIIVDGSGKVNDVQEKILEIINTNLPLEIQNG